VVIETPALIGIPSMSIAGRECAPAGSARGATVGRRRDHFVQFTIWKSLTRAV
jgi:hypothetical protein